VHPRETQASAQIVAGVTRRLSNLREELRRSFDPPAGRVAGRARHALSAAAGGAVLVAWVVALAVAGVFLVAGRDVE